MPHASLTPDLASSDTGISPLFSAMGLQLLAELFTYTPAAIAVTRGSEHVFEFVNPTWVRGSGRPDASYFVGKPIRQALPEVERRYSELMDQAYRTGEPFTTDEAHVRLDREGNGELVDAYFNFLYQPVRNRGGEVDGMLIYAVEVTAQVEARKAVEREVELREQQRDHLMQILDTMPVAVIVTDEEGQIVTRNWVERALSSPVNEQPRAMSEFGRRGVRHLNGAAYEVEDLPLVRSLKKGEVITGEQMLLPVAGHPGPMPVLVNSAPLLDRQARVIGAVVAYSDITAIKELERQKDDFFAAAAHDLRTPVTSVKGLVQLLQRRLQRSQMLPEHVRQTMDQIDGATTRLTRLVDQILDMSRLQMGGGFELQIGETDLIDLLWTLVAAARPLHPRHQVELVAKLGTLMVQCDGQRIERVLANLLDNAVKYSPDGGAVLVTAQRIDASDGSWAVVSVEDDGLGILVHELPKIFDRFQRGSLARGKRIRGTGMGLAYAKQIVAQHGGTLEAESANTKGSRFTVRLPLRSIR